MALTSAFTVTATLFTPTADVDGEGNTNVGYDAGVAVDGCRFGTNQSASTEATQLEDQVTTRPLLRMPPGTPVSARSRVSVRGVLYEVDGQPVEAPSSFTAFNPGPLVQLKVTSG